MPLDLEPPKITPPLPKPPERDLENPPVTDLPTTRTGEITRVSLRKQLINLWRQLRQQGLYITLLEGADQLSRVLTGAPTERFTRITPQLFVGGQYLQRGWPKMRARGVTATINMRREFDDRAAGIAPERHLHLPTIDNQPPTLDDLERGAAFITEEIARGGRVYVHCWEGVGRAPTMAAAYLISSGLSPKEAWDTIAKVRPFIRPTPVQMAQIEAFAQKLKAPIHAET